MTTYPVGKPVRIHHADVRDGMLIARSPSQAFLPASHVRHYVVWVSCWHQTGNGQHGGFSATYDLETGVWALPHGPFLPALANDTQGD